jgi:hypothetical protein
LALVEHAVFGRKSGLRETNSLCIIGAMLTLKSLIGDQTVTAFAAELAAVSGAPCSQQKVSFWLSAGSVPAGWLPVVLELMRRRGMEPTADDLAGLCPQRVVVLNKARPAELQGKGTKLAKGNFVAAKSQLGTL